MNRHGQPQQVKLKITAPPAKPEQVKLKITARKARRSAPKIAR